MILVDTSVWVDHLRTGTPELAKALDAGVVYTHPFVVVELACATLRRRGEVHLLASVLIGPPARLWSRDRRLAAIAGTSKCDTRTSEGPGIPQIVTVWGA